MQPTRIIQAVISAVLLTFAANPSSAQETNLLVNPSFEQGEIGQLPPGWSLFNSGAGVQKLVTATGGHSGKKEAQFSKQAPVQWVYAGQYVKTPINNGEIYRYSGWLKASAETVVMPGIVAGTADGQRAIQAYIPVNVGPEWQKFELFLTVKNGPFAMLRVAAQVLQSGVTVSFDDAELVKMPFKSKDDQTGLFGPTPSDFQRMIEPTDEIVSPHITWSKPDAKGPLHVLYITYNEGMREVVELRERFDLNAEVFTTHTQDEFAPEPLALTGGASPEWLVEKREARLRDLLSHNYDMILIGNIPWDILPKWARVAILAKVQNGAGLFGFIRAGEDPLLQAALKQKVEIDPRAAISAFPYAGLPAFRSLWDFDGFASSTIRFGQYGKGRIALLLGRPPEGSESTLWGDLGGVNGIRVPHKQTVTPEIVDAFPNLHMVHYDYYLALAGHLMNWVAGRAPAVRVVEPSLNARVIQREEPVDIHAVLESDADRQVTVQWAVRNSDSGQVWKQETKSVALHKGRNDFPISAAGLAAGNYFADVWVKDQDKTIDFGSLFLNVHSQSGIQQLDLAADSFLKSEPVRGTITIEGAKAGQTLEITQTDNYGRQVVRKNIPVENGTNLYTFALDPISPLSVIQTIEARLLDGADALDIKSATFTYRDLFPPEDIRGVVAQDYEGDTYLMPTLADTMRHAGIDTSISWVGDSTEAYDDFKNTPYYRFVRPRIRSDAKCLQMGAFLLGNVYTMPEVSSNVEGQYDGNINPHSHETVGSPHGIVRQPSLSNVSYLRHAADFYASVARNVRKFAIPEYDLGDESELMDKNRDASFDDSSILDFQSYVRNQYGTIQRLNEEYGTSYAHWDEVIPIPYEEAKKTGQIPIWIDHRHHMEKVWSDYYARARAAITKEAPGARVGYEGSDDPQHAENPVIGGADDYYLLGQAMTMNNIYYSAYQLDCVRDFSPPGAMVGGGWFGGYPAMWRGGRESLSQRWWLWNTLLRGANAVWLFDGCTEMRDDGTYATFAQDFSPFDFFRPTSQEMQFAEHGVGKLLMSSGRPDDGIAVLYSTSSMLMTAMTDGMPGYSESVIAMPYVLGEAGFQYRMIASQQLEDGILRNGKFRALYLQYAQALSPKEVEEILAFAKSGGVVLADLRPGVADAHGKPYPEGALDALFGVKEDTKKPLPMNASIQLTEKFGDLTGSLPNARADGSLRATTGKAYGKLGDASAVVVNDYGKGVGVLFNLAFGDYIQGQEYSSACEFSDEESAAVARGLVQRALAQRGIVPSIPISPYVPGVHVYHFGGGESQVLGLVWDAPGFLPGVLYNEHDKQAIVAEQSKQVTLDLGTSRYVYDMRTGKYLGQQKTIQRTLSPGTVDLLAVLPYKVEGLDLQLGASTILQGQTLDYTASLKASNALLHVFRIEFTDPDGHVADHYSINATAQGGICHGTLATNLNEKTGGWKITVKDVHSGVTTSANFTVQPSVVTTN